LIPKLEKYSKEQGIVYAVPRGGVPIGYCIAKNFKFPLELLLIKKIGHPLNKEFAVGAVSVEDYIIDEQYNISDPYIKNEIIQVRQTLKENYKKFWGDRKPIDPENKTVIIVDDGIATGNTLLAAIKILRKKNPAKIVVAAPVAPSKTVKKIKQYVDDFICLYVLESFIGVGLYYSNFLEVKDEEVIQLLKKSNSIEKVVE